MSTYIESIVGPAAELHLAVLIIKRKPRDVNLTGGLEDARRNVGTLPVTGHDHVGLIGSIK